MKNNKEKFEFLFENYEQKIPPKCAEARFSEICCIIADLQQRVVFGENEKELLIAVLKKAEKLKEYYLDKMYEVNENE